MENQEQLDAIKDIRNLMKRSSRFLSLSGLSGVLAGIYALAGAYYGNMMLADLLQEMRLCDNRECWNAIEEKFLLKFIAVAGVVLVASLITGFLFSVRKAKKVGQKLFDHAAFRLLFNMSVPLGAGAIFCFILYSRGDAAMVAPTMLVFYGLALISASKYTMDEILYLGLMEIILGLINGLFFLGYGLEFWAMGFGILHIIYGTIMWYKYDREKA
jgi:hypothetical protein